MIVPDKTDNCRLTSKPISMQLAVQVSGKLLNPYHMFPLKGVSLNFRKYSKHGTYQESLVEGK